MSRTELLQQRRLLVALAKRLGKNVAELELETDQLHKLEGDYGQGEDVGDSQELTNQAAEEHLAKSLLGNQEFTLSEIEAALDRLKNNTYGICDECKSIINIERMKALPYARRCIKCAKSMHG
jgi:DnaK suppressor protein